MRHCGAAEDYIPRLLSSIARPDSGAADQAQLAAAAVLPTILEDSNSTGVPPSARRPPLGVLSNVQPFHGGRSSRKRVVSAAPKVLLPQLEAAHLPAAAQGTEGAGAQRNARLAWARRMTEAPMRAVRAARTTYVPLGQQVWLCRSAVVLIDRMHMLRREKATKAKLSTLAFVCNTTSGHPSIRTSCEVRQVWLPAEQRKPLSTQQPEQQRAGTEGAADASTAAGDGRRSSSPSVQLSRSLLCPPAHRLPSYRCVMSLHTRLPTTVCAVLMVHIRLHAEESDNMLPRFAERAS